MTCWPAVMMILPLRFGGAETHGQEYLPMPPTPQFAPGWHGHVLMPVLALEHTPVAADLSPTHRLAIHHGLAYLASRQQPSGAFGATARTGITSLAALAFMSAGNLPGRGEFGPQVTRCLHYVLSQANDDGLISSDSSYGPMYGHAFAALFLAEVYGMSPDPSVKAALQKAARILIRSQSPDGGWRYQAVPFDSDISVTICCVMALRAARDAGVKVPRAVIDNAVDYVRRCQNSDGGFAYMPSGTDSGFARSAAGVSTLYYAGYYDSDELRRGLRYLREAAASKSAAEEPQFFYGHYYASQAMLLAGGEYWSDYFPAIRDRLLSRQDGRTGGWTGEIGPDYATAMALIILQLPNRYPPVFHGKGPGT